MIKVLQLEIKGAGKTPLAELFQMVMLTDSQMRFVEFKSKVMRFISAGEQKSDELRNKYRHAWVAMPYYTSRVDIYTCNDAAFAFVQEHASKLGGSVKIIGVEEIEELSDQQSDVEAKA